MDSQLRQISQLVQEKRYNDARMPLQKYLRDNPDSAYAWYLLSFVAATPADKQKAIRKATQLAPEDQKYSTRLAKLGAVKKRSPVLPLVIFGAVLIAIVAVVFAALRPADTPTADSSTTVAQDSTATQESLQIAAVASAESTTETSVSSIQATDTLAPEATETIADVATTVTETATALPTIDIAIFASPDFMTAAAANTVLLVPPTEQAVAPLPTAVPSTNGTAQPTANVLPVPSSTLASTLPPGAPTVTPGGDAGVPLSTPLDIGAGEMRIVAAVRPASTLINELGGAAANPPTGQQWLLVEALVICSGSDNCAPALSDIRVVGSSGTTYAPAPDFSMPQLFGPSAFAVGQVWGYMGFTIPSSETTLKLALNQDGETYTFALQ
jgi:hypothetical protein